jgi:Xaa-Pro aminopeptidase
VNHGLKYRKIPEFCQGEQRINRKDYPIKSGDLNEPGLYGHFELKIEGRIYSEHIGIRLEDDLLITTKGCENLSLGIPV